MRRSIAVVPIVLLVVLVAIIARRNGSPAFLGRRADNEPQLLLMRQEKVATAMDVVGGTAAPAAFPAKAAMPQQAGFGPIPTMRIRTAELQIRVDSVARALLVADSGAAAAGGFIADSRQTHPVRDVHDAQLVVRVPSPRFDELLVKLRALGAVTSESVNAQDITREYADLETRITVKDDEVRSLRGLLATRTAKLSDILQVERELARAVTELEQMKGERRFDEQQVAMATVTIHLFDRAVAPGPTIATTIAHAFGSAVDALGESVATVVYLLTFLVPWVAVAAGLWVAVRAAMKRTRSAGDIRSIA